QLAGELVDTARAENFGGLPGFEHVATVQLDDFVMFPRLASWSSRVRIPSIFGIDRCLRLVKEMPAHVEDASRAEKLRIHGRATSQISGCGIVVRSAQKEHVYAQVHARTSHHGVKRCNPRLTPVLLWEYLAKADLEIVGSWKLKSDVLPKIQDIRPVIGRRRVW